MSVSLKTQSQLKGQYNLHAKCRYCGTAWFPFPDKVMNPPLSASVKCPKCKSKQHLHWIGRLVADLPSSGPVPFPNLKSVDFEEKKAFAPKIVEAKVPDPEAKQNSPEVAPLPELNESSALKRETRPIFKSAPAGERPIFKASSKFQAKRLAPPAAKPESKPSAPAPTQEIKIDIEPPKQEVEEKPFVVQIERHEVKPPEAEIKTEPKIETQNVSSEPKPVEQAPELEKVEVQPVKEPTPTPEPEARPAAEPEPRAQPKSMFKSSLFKSDVPRPMFKSRIKRDLKHETQTNDVPEQQAGPSQVEAESGEKAEEQTFEERPLGKARKRELFHQKKSEVEVREAPLDDDPEQEKIPARASVTQAPAEQKPVFSSGWPSKKKQKKKILEETGEIESPEI